MGTQMTNLWRRIIARCSHTVELETHKMGVKFRSGIQFQTLGPLETASYKTLSFLRVMVRICVGCE
jgi:hypothetical protein